tara:strand:- start:54 stop:686 length:633 start_codon:yes stop_codon:yes gene_type:complete
VVQGGEVVIVSGMILGSDKKIIEQDPNIKGSKPLMRSKNEDSGIEFTYSLWLNIDRQKFLTRSNPIEIFDKKDAPKLQVGVDGDLVNIEVQMATHGANDEPTITVGNMPVDTWVSVAIIGRQSHIYVYVNGKLKQKKEFSNTFKLNYDNVVINDNDAVNWGRLADFRYYNRALNAFEIMSLVTKGPNKKPENKSNIDNISKYVSNAWYFN